MKNSLFAVLFLAVSAASFYQCQKDATQPQAAATQQSAEDRAKPCTITFTTNVDASICGTDLNNTPCLVCTGFSGTGLVNVPAGGTITFNPVTLIFSVRNTSNLDGKFTMSNANGAIDFELLAGECRNFSLSGCDIN